jgi:hypothetical protein
MESRQWIVECLPDELTLNIFSFLDAQAPRPSLDGFDEEPSTNITSHSVTTLKNVSLVSHSWRRIVLPLLFSFGRVHLPSAKRVIPVSHHLIDYLDQHDESHPQLSAHEILISKDVQKIRKYQPGLIKVDLQTPMYTIEDGDSYLNAAPEEWKLWAPTERGPVAAYLDFLRKHGISRHTRSLVVQTNAELGDKAFVLWIMLVTAPARDLWEVIFATINPARIMIAAHPDVMAILTNSKVRTWDGWMFRMSLHYLELRKPSSLTTPQQQEQQQLPMMQHCATNLVDQHLPIMHCIVPDRAATSTRKRTLLEYGPWTHLAYNEGSSVPAYSQYEYFQHTSPLVLSYILSQFGKMQGSLLSGVKFVSIFPIAGNTAQVLAPIRQIRTLAKLTVKMAPSPDSDVLDDARIGRADRGDLWQEHSDSYSWIIGLLEAREYSQTGGHFCLQVEDWGISTTREHLKTMFKAIYDQPNNLHRWAPKEADTTCQWQRYVVRPGN